ncbi:nitrogen fixation protein FixH [Humitalea rosea]|uniref:Nitrogen fixation protein FixH n=1 Tax=Humitalea rosea TaxID=990373 RepID=A0A2W7I7Y6_9PROT|nr:FixH family protein [Humitalea rosea]PZW43051.1 nitrogen fixation protein FixH [Humitalea rosea]
MRPFDPARGKWIPWIFAGMMTLVVAVNGGLIFAALSTFTGVTTGRAYDQGRVYNHVIEEATRQAALGWTAHVALAAGRLSVVVTDREGLPVAGHMDGLLQRPLDGRELPLSFAAPAPGRWSAEAVPPAAGQWEARLTLTGPAGRHLDIRERIIAP